MLNGPAGLAFALLVACSGPQSALDPTGRGAEQISAFFWRMAGGALVIWLAVVTSLIGKSAAGAVGDVENEKRFPSLVGKARASQRGFSTRRQLP